MWTRRVSALLLAVACLASGCGDEPPGPARPGELTIAAASSLRPAVDQLIVAWNRDHPSTPARPVYGASGALFAQIGAAAPFDIFLSADDVYPRRIHDAGRGSEPFRFATGRLAVWIPEQIDPIDRLDQLTRPRFRKIAVASPNLAPYGEAALEALEGAGIYDRLKGQLVFAANVMEAAHYAESGGAEAAIVSMSLIAGTSLADRGSHLVIPADLYDPIIHEGTLLGESPNRDAAERFVDLLLSAEGREILESSGFFAATDQERTASE